MDTEEIVVVTLQYRLGVFGFLSSGDEHAKGNYGLKDQRMALEWLQENLEVFGGDPRAVTLMGDSGGGVSAQFHMMSPKANGLFQKAIMIGGNALCFWALERDPTKQLRELALAAGIPNANNADTSDIVRRFARMPASDLQKLTVRMYMVHDVSPVFRPTIEGPWSSAVVEEDPLVKWKRGDFEHRPFLWIASPNEQAFSADMYYDPKKRQRIMNDFDNSLMGIGGVCRKDLAPIKKYYFDDAPSEHNIRNVTMVSGSNMVNNVCTQRFFYSSRGTSASPTRDTHSCNSLRNIRIRRKPQWTCSCSISKRTFR